MVDPAPDGSHLDTVLRLTAIALLLRPLDSWLVRAAVLGAAALVLIFPRALRSPALWFGVALAIAIRVADDWPLADNHIYLLAYWTLAIALSLRTPHASATLASSSRWLLGLAFAFAVLWKAVLSPDYLDRRFFRVTLLTDPRFGAAAMLVGGLSAEQLDANRHALDPLPHGAELLDPPALVEPPRLGLFGVAATWGTLLIEASVALLMVLPTQRGIATLRHVVLLIFCGVTYAIAPVAGFGWSLLVMGLAQVDRRRVWLVRAYVAMFLGVLFYAELPWADLIVAALRRP